MNTGARELGFADTGALWRSNYDMPPDEFSAEVERLWQQVTSVLRLAARLRARAGSPNATAPPSCRRTVRFRRTCSVIRGPRSGATCYDLVAPREARGPRPDRTPACARRWTRGRSSARASSSSPRSASAPCRRPSGTARCSSSRPTGTWCATPARGRSTISRRRAPQDVRPGERGRLQYGPPRAGAHVLPAARTGSSPSSSRTARTTPSTRQSATPLRCRSRRTYLEAIGLIDADVPGERRHRPPAARALDSIAFLPFGLLIDQWRWRVFSGEIAPERTTRRGGTSGSATRGWRRR